MRRDILLLHEMIDAAEQAQGLVAGLSVTEVENDRQRRDALLWNFTVLGEAANAVSEETRVRFPEIPWRSPVGLRNRVVHGYWPIDVDLLHTTTTVQLPDFVEKIRAALAKLRTDP